MTMVCAKRGTWFACFGLSWTRILGSCVQLTLEFPTFSLVVRCRVGEDWQSDPGSAVLQLCLGLLPIRHINLCWLGCSTRLMKVRSLPCYSWTERGSGSGSKGKLRWEVRMLVPISCSKAALVWAVGNSLSAFLNICISCGEITWRFMSSIQHIHYIHVISVSGCLAQVHMFGSWCLV